MQSNIHTYVHTYMDRYSHDFPYYVSTRRRRGLYICVPFAQDAISHHYTLVTVRGVGLIFCSKDPLSPTYQTFTPLPAITHFISSQTTTTSSFRCFCKGAITPTPPTKNTVDQTSRRHTVRRHPDIKRPRPLLRTSKRVSVQDVTLSSWVHAP